MNNRLFIDCNSTLTGEPVELRCGCTGHPEPTVSWIKDGEPISFNDNIMMNKKSLLISGVDRSHAGTWTCVASNIAGTDQVDHFLSVEWPPRVDLATEALLDYSVNVGADLVLACPIDAKPIAQFAWFHGDVQIDTTTDMVSLDEMTGTLTISNATLADEGHYACNAFNHHGILITTIEVVVTIPPRIISNLNEVTVETGSRAYLPCKVRFRNSLATSVRTTFHE